MQRRKVTRRACSFLSGLMLLAFAIIQTSCLPLPFTLPVFVQIKLDPGGHVQFINIPGEGSFIVTGRELAQAAQGFDRWRFEANNDFGMIEVDVDPMTGEFSGTGTGTVAGFPNVSKDLNGTINTTTGEFTARLRVGLNGELLGTPPTEYDLNGAYNFMSGMPVLATTPSILGYYAPLGSNPQPQTVHVQNSSTGALGFFAEILTGQNVVSVSPQAGQAPSDLTVGINGSMLEKGNHSFSFRLNGFPEGISDVVIPVEVSIDFPYLNQDGTKGGAHFMDYPVPGSLASSFGWRLSAPGTSYTASFGDDGRLQSTLGDTTLRNGVNLGPLRSGSRATAHETSPLLFVTPGQVNFQVPWEYEGASEFTMQLDLAGDVSFPRTVPLLAYSPGIFPIGESQGAVLISNTDALAAPVGSVPGRNSRPAAVGQFVTIYCTGLGPVTNRPATGAPALGDPLSHTTTPASAEIGGVAATPSFSGLSPGFVGLYQVDVPIPPGVTPGNAVPVTISIGGVTSNTVTIAVE